MVDQSSSPVNQPRGISSPSHAQSQCRLFCLPAELRLQIFTLVLSCEAINLELIGPRENSRKLELADWDSIGPLADRVRAQRPLSLPLTCARAYAEALPLFYATNTLHVKDPDVLWALAQRPWAPWIRRLDFALRLYREPPADADEEWSKVWKALAGFENVQCLRLELYVHHMWSDVWATREEKILRPLKGIVKEGAEAELILSWDTVPQASGGRAEDFLNGWTITRNRYYWPPYRPLNKPRFQ